MQQIKIFKGAESDIESLERQINDWLARNPVRVVQMSGNIAPQSGDGRARLSAVPNDSDLLVLLVYEPA
ncbi:MAG: hypothetical protein KatS3mg108_1531 [Isosphaeraceae bacterium]|jgi:hypothetical protein|nr:MAG: hypothetical protein KatS3mg108_1531 [Isosphaeraceae bacterium]